MEHATASVLGKTIATHDSGRQPYQILRWTYLPKSKRLVLVVLVRQVQPRLNSAALFFWDSPLRRISLPSEILRRHDEMLGHRPPYSPARTSSDCPTPPVLSCTLANLYSAEDQTMSGPPSTGGASSTPLDRPPGRSLACARAADASAFFTAFAVWEWIGQESQWDESHLESSWWEAEEGAGGACFCA